MDERAVRLECLKLALTTNPTHVKPPLDRAAEYATFVMAHETEAPATRTERSDTAKAGAKRRPAPDGQGGKTPRQPGETG
jgi:hypothetical protein